MCKYCEIDMYGDCSDEEIINEDLTDQRGRSLLSVIARIGRQGIYSGARKTLGDGQLCLNVYDTGSDPLIAVEVKIKFCPFCGQEFKKIPV